MHLIKQCELKTKIIFVRHVTFSIFFSQNFSFIFLFKKKIMLTLNVDTQFGAPNRLYLTTHLIITSPNLNVRNSFSRYSEEWDDIVEVKT